MNGSTIVSISRCNELFSTETRHPLATLIELPVAEVGMWMLCVGFGLEGI